MSHDESERLLRAGAVGRVAFSTPSGPHIVPVSYAVVEDAVVIRTSPYSLLGTHGRGSMVAFEVDLADSTRQHDWSVVARGRAVAVSEASHLERIRSAWTPHPWSAGARSLILRLKWTELDGRRLNSGWTPSAETTFYDEVPGRCPADHEATGAG